MRLIVMSDSHGQFNHVRKIVEANKDSADSFIHLSDGLEEFQDVHNMYQQLHFVAVKGNNDWGIMEQKVKIQPWGNALIMMTHGDNHDVKYGTSVLVEAAKQAKVDVALYGHTHVAQCEEIDGIHVINPGTVKGGYRTPSSYLSLELTANSIVPTIILIE